MKLFQSSNPLLSALCCFGVFFQAGPAKAEDSQWAGSCSVVFKGKSTLHNFTGTVDCESFVVSIADIDDPSKAKASSEVAVKAKNMDTGNKKRDAKMRETLEVDTYPEIKVLVKSLSAAATKPKMGGEFPRPTVIPFALAIMGKTLNLTGTVSDWSYANNHIGCTVAFPVSLKDAGINPPSAVGGLVEVKDIIDVQAKLSLDRK